MESSELTRDKNKLTEQYLDLVLKIANTFHRYQDRDDLMQVGNLALIRAINDFDIKRETSLEMFIYCRVLYAMKNYLIKNELVPKPLTFWQDRKLIEKIKNELTAKTEKPPDITEVYKLVAPKWKKLRHSKMSENYFQLLLGNGRGIYLEDPLSSLSDSPDLTTILDMEKLLSILNEKEQKIIIGIYKYGKTLVEIGKELNVTKQRINEIRNLAIEKIKDFLAKDTNLALGAKK